METLPAVPPMLLLPPLSSCPTSLLCLPISPLLLPFPMLLYDSMFPGRNPVPICSHRRPTPSGETPLLLFTSIQQLRDFFRHLTTQDSASLGGEMHIAIE